MGVQERRGHGGTAVSLYDLWDALEARGAVVTRVPLFELDQVTVGVLAEEAAYRLRVLAEAGTLHPPTEPVK